MSGSRPAAGGGRWVEVSPERLKRWLDGFAERHGPVVTGVGSEDPSDLSATSVVTVVGADGAVAECHPAFPPVEGVEPGDGLRTESLVAHALRQRRIGVLLARLGGFAVGVFDGGNLVTSKVDTRLVHGRNKAGGWSQQRFARRREGQARQLTEAAVAVAVRVLLPEADRLDAVVLGGDRVTAEAVWSAPALRRLTPLRDERFLTVPDPRRTVLDETPAAFRAIRIRLLDATPLVPGAHKA
jgi:hypothetical protein